MKRIAMFTILLLLVFTLAAGANVWGPFTCDGDDNGGGGGGGDDDDDDDDRPRATVVVKNKVFWVPEDLSVVTSESFITVLYWSFFNRLPDREGFDQKMDALNAGASRESIVLGFVNSRENENLRGDGSKNNYFLGALYNTLLHRQPDQDGLHHWLDRLNDGWSKEKVIRHFLNSDEYKDKHHT
ncbi:MAG: DUF4214 domain-containing protein [Candidatus Coatesbacteria bacterium]|nr:DUF4214 domain-containing protein [Candidatus Coatesbacteria bacterium]